MPNFFTVDGMRRISAAGQRLLLIQSNLGTGSVDNFVRGRYSNGLSEHGRRYLLGVHGIPPHASLAIELLFEEVRRESFPKIPSRFESVFGCETISDAQAFRYRFRGNNTDPIWEIDGTLSHRGDLNLLSLNPTLAHSYHFAELYWSGQPGSSSPFWEVLLSPPVTAIQQS